jgi:Leucine-rich repeat (LRR) protein
MSTDESSTELQKWHPNSSVCLITDDLIIHQSGETDFRRITALDLHLRDGSLGKIRKIENMESLVNIRQLNISYNALTRIEGLDNLVSLVELNLAENSITKIENLFGLRLLERLSLCGNDIERIPAEISQLKALTVLRLNRNKLAVQKDLENLSPLGNLRELRIDNNPITSGGNGDTRRYAIFVIPLLRVLDNETITAADRFAMPLSHHLLVVNMICV